MTQKFTIDAQIEEVVHAIEYLPRLEVSKYGKKAVIELRIKRMRSALRTLQWVKDNEASIRHFIAEQKSKRILDEIHYGS